MQSNDDAIRGLTVWTVGACMMASVMMGCSSASAEGKKLVVQAGYHDRMCVPMCVDAPSGIANPKMVDTDTGKTVPCQVCDGKLCWVLDELAAGKTKTYAVSSDGAAKAGVEIEKSDKKIVVMVNGKHFTTFQMDSEEIRPYCYPVFGPDQVRMTRGYPMERRRGELPDHHHHRSFYVAHGEFNNAKYNFWHEPRAKGGKPQKDKWDRQIVRNLVEAKGGPAVGRIKAVIDWVGHDGTKVVEETRTMTFYGVASPMRIVDLKVAFDAKYGDVHFGDTKEGGICAIRVAPEIRENGRYGGRLTNSEGHKTEGQAWGKKAKWVDYSRTKGDQYGIAVFDTPGNLRYPTTWHIRGYGLFTANPFGLKYFAKGSGQKGDYTLKKGDELVFQYRVLFHEGDCEGADIAARYEDYVNPPKAEWK